MNIRAIIADELKNRDGVLKMLPSFVARTTFFPGKRLKIHPNDYYAYGVERGALTERWICSVAKADNGELTVEDEGLSFINFSVGEQKLSLAQAVSEAGDLIIGNEYMN